MNMNIFLNVATIIATGMTGYSFYNSLKRTIEIKKLKEEKELKVKELLETKKIQEEKMKELEEASKRLIETAQNVLPDEERKELEDLLNSIIEERKNN